VPRSRATLMAGDELQVSPAELRTRLEAIHGVDHVIIDADIGEIWLVLRADVDPLAAEAAAREAADGTGFTISAAFRPEQRERQRVRFVSLDRSPSATEPQVTFTVTLEWRGQEYTGSATGERSEPIELRTVAAAALNAIAALVPGEVVLKLAGVKQVRAFDAELLVVSLYRPDVAPHNLVGAVVVGEDALRTAVLAVLSGLNRLLGNYLALP